MASGDEHARWAAANRAAGQLAILAGLPDDDPRKRIAADAIRKLLDFGELEVLDERPEQDPIDPTDSGSSARA